MMLEGRSIALGPGEGKSFVVSGDPFTYKVVSQNTDGRRPGTRIKKSAAAWLTWPRPLQPPTSETEQRLWSITPRPSARRDGESHGSRR